MATLQHVLETRTAEAAPELVERTRRRPAALLRLRPPSVRSPKARSASARCASTAADAARAVGLRRRRPVRSRSRRSRSSTRIPARWPSASGCSAATCTARTARTGSRRRRSAIRGAWRRRSTPRPKRSSREALSSARRVVVSTYNEPLITSEWAVAIFKEARAAGLMTAYVSNGNGTPQVLDYIRPWVDLYKVDLKSFDDRHYRQLGGRLEPILDTIRHCTQMGIWLDRHPADSRLQCLR